MGGFNSGRRRIVNIATLEDVVTLDIRQLRKYDLLRSGYITSALWRWHGAGERRASVNILADCSLPDVAVLTISYSVDGRDLRESVSLEAVPCRYGGRRYYFLCPATSRRCEVLACVHGHFASRQHHRLAYASQSEGALDRLARKVGRAEAKAFGKCGYSQPRGANRKRLTEKWSLLSEIWEHEVHLEGVRRFGIWGR